MKVSCETYGCREYTLAVLTLGLAVELLPPLAKILKLRIVGDEDLDCLAVLCVKEIPHCGILKRRVFLRRNRTCLFHRRSALKHLANVKSRKNNREKSNRSEHRKAASDIVLDDECPVTLLSRKRFERASVGVGNGNDALCCLGRAVLILYVLLDDAERDCRLRGCAGL